jgi:hypothetical protein
MPFPFRPVLSCAALLASLLADPAAAAPRAAPAPDMLASMRRQAMLFFVARGAPGACGPGCSEWIAAEGVIDPEAPQRLRDLLAALERRDLPIYFHSTGGGSAEAVAIGTLLRERRMRAGVGRSLPEGCRGGAAEGCRKLVQSRREHRARLLTAAARCLSACVYALVGASAREVARDARLGVHSVRVVPFPGRAAGAAIPTVAEVHARLKRYVLVMGVDPSLIDAAARVSAARVHYLTREQIVRFGIEPRDRYETAWLGYRDKADRPIVIKAVTQARGAHGREYGTASIQIACAGAGPAIWIVYRRELASDEAGGAVRVAAGDLDLALRADKAVERDDVRSLIAGPEFLLAAIAGGRMVFTEQPAEAPPRAIAVSTAGLAQAAQDVRKSCRPPLFDAPAARRPVAVGGGR